MEVAFLEPIDTLRLEPVEDSPELKHVLKITSPAREYVLAFGSYSDKSTMTNLMRDAQRTRLKQTVSAASSSGSSAAISGVGGDELGRDALVTRIVAWSRRELSDAPAVMREIRELAAQLERRRTPSGAGY